LSQALAGAAAGRDHRQALLDITGPGDVQLRQRLDDGPLGIVEMTQDDQMVSQGSRFVAGQALNAATICACWIRPVRKASRLKRR
jgi:hypothetical protein